MIENMYERGSIGSSEVAGEPKKTIEFGPKNLTSISLRSVGEVEQVRKYYDPDALKDLAESIASRDEEGKLTPNEFNLLNPLTCNLLIKEQAEEFLQEHARFYGCDVVDVSELPHTEDGNVIILIAGHRRKRAIELLVGELTEDATEVSQEYLSNPDVAVNMQVGLTFMETVIMQLRENVHEKVTPYENAKQVYNIARHLAAEEGVVPTKQRLANMIGISRSVVSGALNYMRLPEGIRKVSEEHRETYPYSVMVEFSRYMDVQHRLMRAKGYENEVIEKAVSDRLEILASVIAKARYSNGASVEKCKKIVAGYVEAIVGELAMNQDELISVQEYAVVSDEARHHARGSATMAAGHLAALVRKYGEQILKPEVADSLARAISTEGLRQELERREASKYQVPEDLFAN